MTISIIDLIVTLSIKDTDHNDIVTLSIKDTDHNDIVTLSIKDTDHNDIQHYRLNCDTQH
jgi:hypothetical protein